MEILLFLPAKSLIRFKCVCKSWHALIRSRQVITMHLNHNNNSCLLVKHCLSDEATGKQQNVLSLISDLDNDFSSIASVNVDVPFHCVYEEPEVELVGHHNGIICLSAGRDDVVLCNPAMREFRALPRSSCIPKPSDPNLVCYAVSVGFGYDCQTNDYKVVMIMNYWHALAVAPFSSRAEVYTLSTDSWREIKDVQLGAEVVHTLNFQMHFNGVYYWRAVEDDYGDNYTADREMILSFDMANEVFRKIPMRDFCSEYDENYYTSLMVFKESITLIHYHYYEADQKSFEFWVMDEFGVKGSWKKLFSVGPLPGIEMPLVFWKNSELLMDGGDGRLISYNLKTQEIRNLPIHWIPNELGAAIYVNSLVSTKAS